VSERFYKGEELEKKDIINILKKYIKEDATFIIAGKESVNASIEAEIINKNAVKKIAGVPHILILA